MPINPSPSLSPLKSPPTKGILDGTLLILANGTRVPSILVNSENPYTPEIDIPRELSNIGKSLFALITPSFMKIPFEFIFISADAFLNSIPESASRVIPIHPVLEKLISKTDYDKEDYLIHDLNPGGYDSKRSWNF